MIPFPAPKLLLASKNMVAKFAHTIVIKKSKIGTEYVNLSLLRALLISIMETTAIEYKDDI